MLTLTPIISKTEEFMSLSVILLMYPLFVVLSQIWSGFDPIEYKIDKKPYWYLFLNIIKKRIIICGGFLLISNQ